MVKIYYYNRFINGIVRLIAGWRGGTHEEPKLLDPQKSKEKRDDI